jgi:hypothetical protein
MGVATLVATWLFSGAPFAAQAAAPEVETAVSATQVEAGEALVLQLRLRGAAASAEPDLSALAPDFEVNAVQRVQRTSVVNGARDASVDYVVQLAPRREGDLVIPALPVGSAASEPVPIRVAARAAQLPAPAYGLREEAPSAAAEPVLLEARVDRANPYEQERVVLTVELVAEGELLDGALSQPEISGLAVEPLGKDRPIEKMIDGHRYRGIERNYGIVPDASGTLVVPPIRFEGRVRTAQPAPRARMGGMPGRSFFDGFFSDSVQDDFFAGFFGGGPRRLAVESKSLRLEVRERPEAVAGHWWLPARDVSLKESLEPGAGPLRVGEPLTRRIEIRADGVSPAQLPALEAPEIAGVKRYAEAPEIEESVRGTVRVDETTLIATQPGTVTLPAVELAWWDTKSDTLRSAALAARTLEVLPALAGSAEPRPADAAPAAAPAAPVAVPPPEAAAARRRPEPRGSAALVAGLALVAVLLAVGITRRRRTSLPSGAPPPRSRRTAARALRRACRRNDPAAAEAALRALGTLQGDVPDGLAREIAHLMALRYSTAGTNWQGAALWTAWGVARKTRRSGVRAGPGPLPPLYPTP